MAETLRIEIPIETIDNTDPELSNVTRNFERMERAAESADSAARKANTTVTQFDRQAEKTEKSLAKWAKEKYEILLEAKDKITPILSMIGNGLRGFAGKTWNVTMKAIDLVTSPVRGIINLLKNPVFQVGAVLGVSIGMKDTIETYKDFEAAMSQVKAISGAAGSDMVKLERKAKEMGATTKYTAEESAEAFNYMAMAGWKAKDMLGGIEGILNLAAAANEELSTTSDIVTDALTAFNMRADQAGHFADVLAAATSNANTTVSGMGETFKYAGTMAGTLKYSIEDVALATGLMANSSIKGTMAGTALNSIFTRLSTNTNGARDALEELGIYFFKSNGSARDLSDVLDELRAATADYSDAQKSSLANTIAGMEAQKGLLAILNASTEDYDKLSEAVNNADGAAAQMSETMLDNLQGSITLLQSAADGVKLSFGERLSPYVRRLANWLTAQMPAVEQGLNEFMDWIDTKIDRMQRKFNAIVDTREWQDADFFGKIKIAWDEFIAEPFSEWWNSTGKAKFAGFAQDIGAGIGTGLKTGIMAILGINIDETMDEGVSIGRSFAAGFSEGFNFEEISGKLMRGFGNMLSSAGKLLPGGESAGLSSIVSAIILSKMASPLVKAGKGAFSIGKGLFGINVATGTSLAGSLIGSTGNAMVSGSGLLGGLANVGYALNPGSTAGMYFGSTAGTMSGGTAALAGGGAIAGGAAAAATLISSALDAYKAVKSEDAAESKAYGDSAAWKAGGVAAGAAIGTLILPGVGTAIGAGIGGIAGWVKGNSVKNEYQEDVAEMQKEAEKAQKVFEATGMSIEDVTFKNQTLVQAMNDAEVSAEQFALMFQEECANVAKKTFGDISLSLAEVKKIADEITFGEMSDGLDEFSTAAAASESALNKLQSAMLKLKKENWKAGLGMELSDTDQDSYKGAIEDFLNAGQELLDSKHYEAAASIKLLAGDGTDTNGIDSYYINLKNRMEDLGSRLTDTVAIALNDGVITLDESAEIENLQRQISEITGKVSSAESDAGFMAMKIKYGGSAMDIDSFRSLQEALQANAEAASGQYDNALTVTLTNLNLQRADNAITQEEYDTAVSAAREKYHGQINALSAKVETFQLESISEAFEEQLDGILPELEGTTAEKLGKVLDGALALRPEVSSWSIDDIREWFGLEGLDTAAIGAISELLKATAETIPTEAFSISGAGCGAALTDSAIESILTETPSLRSAIQEACEAASAEPFEVETVVKLKPSYEGGGALSYLTGGHAAEGIRYSAIGSTYLTGGHAAGGFVSGGPQLSWLAEEGYGEFVIPTNPSRRARALDLYQQAGAALGVSAYADGGYVGGPILRDTVNNYKLSSDVNRNAPMSYNETTDGNYDGSQSYEAVPAERESSLGSSPVQVSVSVAPEFVIHGGDGQSEEKIVQVIRKHMKEMADELGGEIAGKLEEVFSNMPLKEA